MSYLSLDLKTVAYGMQDLATELKDLDESPESKEIVRSMVAIAKAASHLAKKYKNANIGEASKMPSLLEAIAQTAILEYDKDTDHRKKVKSVLQFYKVLKAQINRFSDSIRAIRSEEVLSPEQEKDIIALERMFNDPKLIRGINTQIQRYDKMSNDNTVVPNLRNIRDVVRSSGTIQTEQNRRIR